MTQETQGLINPLRKYFPPRIWGVFLAWLASIFGAQTKTALASEGLALPGPGDGGDGLNASWELYEGFTCPKGYKFTKYVNSQGFFRAPPALLHNLAKYQQASLDEYRQIRDKPIVLDLDLLVFSAGLRIKGDPALKIRVFKSCAEHFQGAYDAGQPVPQKYPTNSFLIGICTDTGVLQIGFSGTFMTLVLTGSSV